MTDEIHIDPLSPGDHGDYFNEHYGPKSNGHAAGGVKPDAPPLFKPEPYIWRDAATIPRRECLYADHYFRKFTSATIAAGGLGKSSLVLGEIISMALKLPGLDEPPENGVKCWYINGEEPEEEMWRRVAAFCQHSSANSRTLEGLLFINSMAFKLASYGPNENVILNEAAFAALEEGIKNSGIDVTVLDPWVSFLGIKERDNEGVDVVVKRLAKVAANTNSSIEIVHHTRKPPPGHTGDMTTDDARGASALISACRSARVLNRMSTKTATDLGIEDRDRRLIFRIDEDKQNLRPPANAKWGKLASVIIGNGESIQAIDRWTYPDAFADVTTQTMRDVRHEVGIRDDWRADSRAKKWIGNLLAQKMRITLTDQTRAQIKTILAKWFENGVLAKVERTDASTRHTREFVVPGDWNEDLED
jgi:RecA-family ATPase